MTAAVEVVFASDAREQDELTRDELDFRDLASNPRRSAVFHAWCDEVRLAWEHENVLWLHGYRDGKPIWRRERPPPEAEPAQPPAKSQATSKVPRFQIEPSLTLNPKGGSHGKETRPQARRQQPRQ